MMIEGLNRGFVHHALIRKCEKVHLRYLLWFDRACVSVGACVEWEFAPRPRRYWNPAVRVPVPFALGTDSKYALVISPCQQVNLSYIAPYFNKLKDTTKVLWMLQEPVAEEKLSPNRAMITNQQITKYNKVAASVIEESSAQLWTSNVMIAKSYLKDSKGKNIIMGRLRDEFLDHCIKRNLDDLIKIKSSLCAISTCPFD